MAKRRKAAGSATRKGGRRRSPDKAGGARAKKRRTGASARRPGARTTRPGRRTARAAATPKTAHRRDGVAPGMQPLSTYLIVKNLTAALDFYERAFNFTRRFVMPGPDGQPVHAEMTHGDSVLMVGAETPDNRAPASPGATSVTLYSYVPDVDRTTEQARNAGATVYLEPKDESWGDRVAGLLDPEGHRWMLATFKKLVPFEEAGK